MANTTTPNFRGVHDMASSVADKTKDAATTFADKAKDAATHTADRAKEFGKSAADMADAATAKVGTGMESVADKLRDKAPREGVLHNAASKVADTLEKGGRYLEQEGITGMASDLTNVIKRNPIPAVLVGVGIGFLLAQAIRR